MEQEYVKTLTEYLNTIDNLIEELEINSQEDVDNLKDDIEELRSNYQDKLLETEEDDMYSNLLNEIVSTLYSTICELEKIDFSKDTKEQIVDILENTKDID